LNSLSPLEGTQEHFRVLTFFYSLSGWSIPVSFPFSARPLLSLGVEFSFPFFVAFFFWDFGLFNMLHPPPSHCRKDRNLPIDLQLSGTVTSLLVFFPPLVNNPEASQTLLPPLPSFGPFFLRILPIFQQGVPPVTANLDAWLERGCSFLLPPSVPVLYRKLMNSLVHFSLMSSFCRWFSSWTLPLRLVLSIFCRFFFLAKLCVLMVGVFPTAWPTGHPLLFPPGSPLVQFKELVNLSVDFPYRPYIAPPNFATSSNATGHFAFLFLFRSDRAPKIRGLSRFRPSLPGPLSSGPYYLDFVLRQISPYANRTRSLDFFFLLFGNQDSFLLGSLFSQMLASFLESAKHRCLCCPFSFFFFYL